MKYCLWYQVCRMFERARIELAAFNRVDRSVDTAQKPLRIGCEVKKGFDDSEIRAEFSELPLGIFSSTRNFSHWIFKTFLLFFFSLLFSSSFFFFFPSSPVRQPLRWIIESMIGREELAAPTSFYIRFHWLTIRYGYITMIMPNQWRHGMHYSFQLRATSFHCLILIRSFSILFLLFFFLSFSFFFLLYTHITSGDISGSLSYLFSLSMLLYSDLLVRFYNSARPRISNRMNISWYLASFSVLQRVWLR